MFFSQRQSIWQVCTEIGFDGTELKFLHNDRSPFDHLHLVDYI